MMHQVFQKLFRSKRTEEGKMPSKIKPTLIWCAVSDVGCIRKNNEDNYLLDDRMNENAAARCREAKECIFLDSRHIACVFDGMGGGEAGELASAAAAQSVRAVLLNVQKAKNRDAVDEFIRSAFLCANNAVLEYRREYRIFGTTGTVVVIDGKHYKVYHLGDSRAYLYRDYELFQLTQDQTMAQLKIDSGMYDENSLTAEAEKHQLTEYIGKDVTGKYIRPVESAWNAALSGDILLLCSDGLYDTCEREALRNMLSAADDIQKCANELVEKALEHGASDNVTCILLQFQ